MHTLLIHQGFVSPDDAGGTRHYELGKRFVAAGHDFTIVASDVNYLEGQKHIGPLCEEIDGIQVRRAWTYNSLHEGFGWRIVAFLSFMVSSVWKGLCVRRVDVVIGTSPPLLQGLSAWVISVLKWKPMVLEIRDLWPEFAIDIGVLKNPLLIRLSRCLERFLYWRASHIIVNSPAYQAYLMERGTHPGRVSLIANGVDPSMFEAGGDGSDFRREWGAQLDGKFVVTYTGALGLANDLETVLDAAVLLKDDSALRFLIVGDGMKRSELQRRAIELGLDNVVFAGARPKSEIPQILAGSDACVATLKDIAMFRTTYPNKVFDYMAAAKPMVLGIDGVIRQVVEAAGGGIVVPPGDSAALADAVRRLRRDPGRGAAMGESAREYVRLHFHRDQHASQFHDVMSRIAPGKSARRAPKTSSSPGFQC